MTLLLNHNKRNVLNFKFKNKLKLYRKGTILFHPVKECFVLSHLNKAHTKKNISNQKLFKAKTAGSLFHPFCLLPQFITYNMFNLEEEF